MELASLLTSGTFALVFTGIGIVMGMRAGRESGRKEGVLATKTLMTGLFNRFLRNAPDARAKWNAFYQDVEKQVAKASEGNVAEKKALLERWKADGILPE